MRANIRAFVASVAECFDMAEPIFEFGSYIVAGQEHLGDLRELFPGRRYVGCDMRAGPGVDRIEDLGRLTLPDDSVPSILCLETLEHVFEVRRAIDEIIRVLAPGGIVVISTPLNFYLHDYPGDYWRLTPSCLDRLLSPLGATIVGRQGVESFPHTVFAVGCKDPVPDTFASRVGRFTSTFQRRLRELEAAEPRWKKFKRRYLGLLRSKGERRRERAYYETQFTAWLRQPQPAQGAATLAGLLNSASA